MILYICVCMTILYVCCLYNQNIKGDRKHSQNSWSIIRLRSFANISMYRNDFYLTKLTQTHSVCAVCAKSLIFEMCSGISLFIQIQYRRSDWKLIAWSNSICREAHVSFGSLRFTPRTTFMRFQKLMCSNKTKTEIPFLSPSIHRYSTIL